MTFENFTMEKIMEIKNSIISHFIFEETQRKSIADMYDLDLEVNKSSSAVENNYANATDRTCFRNSCGTCNCD